MLILILALFGCKTAPKPSSTHGDTFHGGESRIFTEQQGNVLLIWKADRRQPEPEKPEPKGKE